MLNYERIETLVRQDYEQFYDADLVIDYFKKKHIRWVCTIVINAFANKTCYLNSELTDMIHGLNHLFFLGMDAGIFAQRQAMRNGEELNNKQTLSLKGYC